MRTVLGYVDADVVELACVHIPVGRPDIGADGVVSDQNARNQIIDAVRVLARHAETARRRDL